MIHQAAEQAELAAELAMDTRPLTARITPGWLSFADGFLGSLCGGLIYTLAVAYVNPADLDMAFRRVLALSCALGAFEMWRVSGAHTGQNLRKGILWTLIGSFALWCALGASLELFAVGNFFLTA